MLAKRTFAAAGSSAEFRTKRHKQESRRARANLHLLLSANAEGVRYRSADPMVTTLAAACLFAPHDLIIVRVRHQWRTITLVIAPRRIWHSVRDRQRLFVLKTNAKRLGSRVILVPEPQLRREPRLSIAERVVGSVGTSLSISERLRIETHVLCSRGDASLASCTELLPEHPDAEKAVLALVHAGRLTFSWGQGLGPATLFRHATDRDNGPSKQLVEATISESRR